MTKLTKLMPMLVAAAMPLVCSAGWEFTSVTTCDSAQSNMMNMVTKAWADSDQARIEFVESGNPMMGKGTYMLVRDGGKTMYLVNPAEKKYSVWDMDAMMGMAGGAMKMMNMKILDPKVEKLLEEDGGKVAGYPTRHYRIRTSYTTQMSFFGRKMTSVTQEDEDIWSTTRIANPGADAWFKRHEFKSGSQDLDALMKAQMDKVEGFPLRRETIHVTTDAQGKEQKTKTVMEIKSIKETTPDAKLFALPTGYTEQPLMPTGKIQPPPDAGEGAVPPSAMPPTNTVKGAMLRMLQQRMNRGQ